MSLIGFWNRLFKRNARIEVRAEDAEDVFWSKMFEPRRIVGPICWEPRTNWRTFWRDAGIDEPLDLSHVNREMWWGATEISRSDHLRTQIERNRRNKKKVSHLVAELAELEGGK